MPLFQSVAKCKTIDTKIFVYSYANKTHFHNKGFARSLVLNGRVFGTRKLPPIVDQFQLLPPRVLSFCSPGARVGTSRGEPLE